MASGFQRTPSFQVGYQQSVAALAPFVVLFPVEPLRFRTRWDKTMYAWSIFSRDMRAPQDGYRPNKDHFVSVEQAMRV